MSTANNQAEVAMKEQGAEGGVHVEEEVGVFQLPAPAGWKKKKFSGIQRKNEVVFVSPNGEEMRSRRQVDRYLKSHPGGPLLSEFDWSTGDTPRRSARISERVKAVETVEDEPPKKKGKRSSSKKISAEGKDVKDGKENAPEEETVASEEKKEIGDAEMKGVEDKIGKEEHGDVETVVKEDHSIKDSIENCNNSGEETHETITVKETNTPVENCDSDAKKMAEEESYPKDEVEKKDQDEKVDQRREEHECDADEKAAEHEHKLDEKPERADKEETAEEIAAPVSNKVEFSANKDSNQDGHETAEPVDVQAADAKPKDENAEDTVAKDVEASDDAKPQYVNTENEVASDVPAEDVNANAKDIHSMNCDDATPQHKASPIEC